MVCMLGFLRHPNLRVTYSVLSLFPSFLSQWGRLTSPPSSLCLGPYKRARGTVRVPGSKSLSNRALLLAAQARGDTILEGVLDAEDTQMMLHALSVLGIAWERDGERCLVRGAGSGFPTREASLFLGNAGTAVRLLTAALAMCEGHYEIRGVPRMHERPIADLVDALRQIGAQIRYMQQEGFLPLLLESGTLFLPSSLRIRGNVSSQFLTALLVALPLMRVPHGENQGAEQFACVEVEGALISKPYVDMTLQLMRQFGVEVQCNDTQDHAPQFIVPVATGYTSPGYFSIEGDASSASYFLAAGALGGGPVRIEGVGADSIQGDIQFADALAKMGATIAIGPNWMEASGPVSSERSKTATHTASLARFNGLDIDCQAIPDAAMTLAVLALFARTTTTLRGIASWRVKETDRIAAMACELQKLGAIVDSGMDFLRITPPTQLIPNVSIHTYDDHRMAMCFSLVSLAGVPITICDPACVNKTYPDYFKHFASIVHG